ncbi:MAG: hypothetical protein IPO06_29330 [Leptospiraceae bacterium]|nr:hypothetical protein [Leptospiraceae bacterium]MBK9503405.1 hypothetical protein [Leptospiraceae bacterium]
MSKTDRILTEFLKHELVLSETKLNKETIPKKVEEAKNSGNLLISAIATIVEQVEKGSGAVGIDTLMMKKINTVKDMI